jgi:NAD(P)-dependent dehydrogenase (short-subunit alcohol dehydrogenase family)
MMTVDEWVRENIPSLKGKTAIVTGANSGLGLQTTRLLAGVGAHVVMAVRDMTKGHRAAEELRERIAASRISVMLLDLSDLASIGRFADGFRSEHGHLDILINNAGVMAIPHRHTVDGFEMQFGTNHLGHFALTGLLLPLLLHTSEGRIVTVSSGIHVIGRINFDDLQSEQHYSDFRVYAQSKLANLLFTYELQRRLEGADCRARAVAVHPGYASTNLQSVGPQMAQSKLRTSLMSLSNRVLAQTAEMGALPTVFAAASPQAEGGGYYGPGGLLGQRGLPKKVASSPASHDRAVATRLWEVSQELTGVTYAF